MPKLSKNKKKLIAGLLKEVGCSKAMTDSILRSAQAETEQEGISATRRLHRVLLEDLKRQKKEGVSFGKADLQELFGQDEIPPEFQELLKNKKSTRKWNQETNDNRPGNQNAHQDPALGRGMDTRLPSYRPAWDSWGI